MVPDERVEVRQITVHTHSSGEAAAGGVAEADDTDEGRRACRRVELVERAARVARARVSATRIAASACADHAGLQATPLLIAN